jgi:Uma2 family endonuclease
MRMAVADKLTIEDFETLPYALAHNHELVDGELVDVSGNTTKHLYLQGFLVELLRPHVRVNGLGRIISEQEYQFGENAHGPDVSFIVSAKEHLIEDRRVQLFVPDLAIEIVSRNDTFGSIVRKARRYLQFGTSEVWVISMESREVYCYSQQYDRIMRETETLSTSLIPGFSIRIADLFDQA